MNPETLQKLEYDRIKQDLVELAVTFAGKARLAELAPLQNARLAEDAMQEAEEAMRVASRSSGLPLPSLQGMEAPLSLMGKGYILSLEDLGHIALFLRGVGQWKRYMLQREDIAPRIAGYARSLYELKSLLEELDRSILYSQLLDSASPELGKIRRRLRTEEDRLKRRIEALMGKYRNYLQEPLVTKRGDHYTLPIKKEYRKQVPGTVLDESSSGQTLYIEPSELASIQFELSAIRAEEAVEEDRIRSLLTGSVEANQTEIRLNVELIAHYDFVFAKGKYGHRLNGRKVKMNETGRIRLIQASHPFLTGKAVPLHLSIGEHYRGLIITGPNTGGKTVTLKTVGLLTLMAQSGLLVPASEDSELSIFRLVEADIGDNQSLDESLSTFSAHMKNILNMLQQSDERTLILLDELAAGTDPGEGVGLSIAVLEELARRGAVILASTHFGEIKTFAADTPGFENARMEFDPESLRPLYQLTIGEAGSSYAFQIASRLGIPDSVIERAREWSARRTPPMITLNPESTESTPPPLSACSLSEASAPKRSAAPGHPSPRQPGPTAKKPLKRPETEKEGQWKVGDRVFIPHLKQSGVVVRLADERGNLLLLVKKEKLLVNRKRIKPFIDRKHLYPENYDMDIVFESKENRKKRTQLRKHHVEGLTIETPDDDWKKLH
ncbi:DNA mismatch repair protein MutS [Gorillibacterium sp. CAU 1737]|uniref:endonuclease MutS2 n=1 Tax=Gorillibacterium sp. CAU 1737 TaxID=3140362 RepID=UPI0032601B6E